MGGWQRDRMGHVPRVEVSQPRLEALFPLEAMGETAENIFDERPHLTREKQDAFALESQRRAVEAIQAGRFKDQIVPVEIPQKKKDPIVFATDEHPRYRKEGGGYVLDTSLEQLAKLAPAFRKGGTVTRATPAVSMMVQPRFF